MGVLVLFILIEGVIYVLLFFYSNLLVFVNFVLEFGCFWLVMNKFLIFEIWSLKILFMV